MNVRIAAGIRLEHGTASHLACASLGQRGGGELPQATAAAGIEEDGEGRGV